MTGPNPNPRTTSERLADLDNAVLRLSGMITKLAQQHQDAKGPSIWAWEHLGADLAAAQWHGLVTWLRWLIDRYPKAFREFPPCWYLHPDAVEELTALWAAWQAAYHGNDRPRDDLIAWHDRWLPGTTLRLLGDKSILTVCAHNKTHTEPTMTGATRNTFIEGPERTLEEHIAADVDDRAHRPVTP